MLRLFYKFPVSTNSLKFSEMELEDDDDIRTMISIYCPLGIKNLSLVELFAEIAEPDPIQVCPRLEIHPEVLATIEDGDEGSDSDDQSHRDLNDNFSDPDLDNIPKDIEEEGPIEGENVNPHSTENTGPGLRGGQQAKASILVLGVDGADPRAPSTLTQHVEVAAHEKKS
ncbi:hypothetical protein J1N35_001361 [Gossypium stocksii]|uniref:Uncharacterized protein n=1 Tax=Gossypium stocksii TaxID=47602 RepID=A0A9D3WJS8_9ROSI|nr:hypothetical protein J1N35_001361 [Gossypium stocksii]